MLRSIIKAPCWILSRITGTAIGVVKLIFGTLFGIVKFIMSHATGTIFGAVVGLLLGKKHVGVKLFSPKKRSAARKK